MKDDFRNRLKKTMDLNGDSFSYYSLTELEKAEGIDVGHMPVTLKILLESMVRQYDAERISRTHIESLISWKKGEKGEIAFKPGRVLMQDFTGVPGIVDLAVMRDALADLGGDPAKINPQVPVNLIIDHSVQVDRYASASALSFNADMEFERNKERYVFLKWASESFSNFSVVPPATGICHQVNLEYLAELVRVKPEDGGAVLYPDSLLGTDSHTTMINGLGVLGWGVGGIEAEAAILGQPMYFRLPDVVGVSRSGALREGVTATDLVLTVTEMLRDHGVVGKFVEFFGPALQTMNLPDRATVSNMCPEYGATAALFPIDNVTTGYLRDTGRAAAAERVEAYCKEQGLYCTPGSPALDFNEVLELDVSQVGPCIAGPKRPQDRIPVEDSKRAFRAFFSSAEKGKEAEGKERTADPLPRSGGMTLTDGSVVISSITSCTNTSNPDVMIAAGLLAKNAVKAGLRMPAYVKTSLAPGSRVVSRYLDKLNLTPYLEALGYHLVGYGCMTCIGNSGPLRPEISRIIREENITAAGVLSGNRNFEGRIHPDVKANYLASPPLVVAYGLAGTVDIDLMSEPIGKNLNGEEIFLKDLWPPQEEIRRCMRDAVGAGLFEEEYSDVYTGNEIWNAIAKSGEERYAWTDDSTYIRKPTFFDGLCRECPALEPIKEARVLALLGDSITTDHISPAGSIADDSPAAVWLEEQGVERKDFNTYGSRRGNHEVMMRGTFANIRIRNALLPGTEGGMTRYLPADEPMSIYDAAMRYKNDGTSLIVIAGKDYGMGSSRDWAAKGTCLLGIKAVIAESFERIHRSNLIGMGVLPLQFMDGENAASLGLSGEEVFDIEDVGKAGQCLTVTARGDKETKFSVLARLDTKVELDYYRNGGILHMLLRQMA